MENIEIKKVKENNCICRNNKYTPMDDERYILYVNGIEVVSYRVIYFRNDISSKYYSMAEIEYINLFDKENNSKYLNKGYTKYGLDYLTNMLLTNEIPYIYLSINPDNEISRHVAFSCGYFPIDDKTFGVFHNDAIKLYNKSVDGLRNSNSTSDKELYFMKFINFCNEFSKYNSFCKNKVKNK